MPPPAFNFDALENNHSNGISFCSHFTAQLMRWITRLFHFQLNESIEIEWLCWIQLQQIAREMFTSTKVESAAEILWPSLFVSLQLRSESHTFSDILKMGTPFQSVPAAFNSFLTSPRDRGWPLLQCIVWWIKIFNALQWNRTDRDGTLEKAAR